jgi:hypothetical protein
MVHAFASAIVIPHRRCRWLGNFNLQQQLQWRHNSNSFLHSSINDDDEESWGFDDDNNNLNKDTRLDTLRSLLESSWNQPTMGIVPTTPTNAAIAATECISNAMTSSSSSSNIMMIDLRLPSYDIAEGQRAYDIMAVYNFGVELAHRMAQIGLVRKSLLLVRNGRECEEIQRVLSRRRRQRKSINNDEYENDDDDDEDNLLRKWTKEDEADEFRKKLMSSWESSSYEDNALVSSTSSDSKSDSSEGSKVIIDDINSASHRLWSMVGNELNKSDIDKSSSSSVVDTFNDIIAAVDIHARLQTNEDAIIILSPYDTTDIVALRRILSRYGQTPRSTPIIIVNSRFDTNPTELDNALLVYGMLPLVAKAVRKVSSRAEMEEDDTSTNTPGLRAVIMKRYPKDWTVYVDVNGDGFVEAKNDEDRSGIGGGTTQSFPSPEWIAQRVQAHVEGLLRRRDMQ